MGKQYISTASASKAHELDILGVTVTNKYTITVSSDGYANFWDNKQEEGQDPNDLVRKEFINKVGVHHIDSYESILPNSSMKLTLVVFVSFDGSATFKRYINDDINTLTDFEASEIASESFWAAAFYKDPESKQDFFIGTQPNGLAKVYTMLCEPQEDKVIIKIEKFGTLDANNSSFPNSLAVSQNEDKKLAIGYTNGDVLLFDLITLKPIYTFRSTDLQTSSKSINANSIPRVIRFSPGGSVLAVARDNQSAGSVTLYDVKYGENIGSLTTPSHSSKTTIGGFAHNGWVMGMSFNLDGSLLATCGFDKCVRVWNMETREREATINVSISDLENTDIEEGLDTSIVSGVSFISKGVRGGLGSDTNEGLVAISFDKGIRWYREAGGI